MAYETVPATSKSEAHSCDVLVVGAGNAALCAALAARDKGARVTVLEAAPEEEAGGNSRFAGGVMRFQYDSVHDLQKVCEIPEAEIRDVDWDSNTTDEFYDDMYRVTSMRTDPRLCELLVTRSLEGMIWLRSQGVLFSPNYRHQSVVINGKRKFFGRFPLWVSGGGAGLVQYLTKTALKKGVEIFYATRAVSLIYDGESVQGVVAKRNGKVENSLPRSWSLPAAGSNPIRSGVRAIWGLDGIWPRSAARVSTWGRGCAWRWTSAHAPMATGPVATPSHGSAMRRSMATSICWRAPTVTAIPTRS